MCLCVCPSVSSGSPQPPSHIYPAQPCPTSVIPVADRPWPPGLPPTSYSTVSAPLSSATPESSPPSPSLPPPLCAPAAPQAPSQAPSPSSRLPSHPLSPKALGREEASPKSGKEATGTARHSQRERKEGCSVPVGERFPVFSHSQTQAHSRGGFPRHHQQRHSPEHTWTQSNEKADTHLCFHSFHINFPANISLGYSWLCFKGKRGPMLRDIKKSQRVQLPPPLDVPAISHLLLPPSSPLQAPVPGNAFGPWCQTHKTHTYPQTHTLRYSHSQLHRYTETCTFTNTQTCTKTQTPKSSLHSHTYT